MNKKLTLSVVILLLVGAIAIAVINTRKEDAAGEASAGTGGASAKSSAVGDGASSGASVSKGSNRAREARERGDAELVAKYGEARTALSRQVAGNVVDVLDDAIAMGEMMVEGGMGRGFGGGRMMLQGALRGTGIELTDEQKDEAAKFYADFQKRELDKTKDVVNSLKKDSSALVELFLAGDAKSRGEMSEDEFAEVRGSMGDSLANVINPTDPSNFRPRPPLEDESFRTEFEAILDDEQRASLAAKSEADESAAEPVDTSITSLPTMDLETLDEAVGSTKKMTSGFRSVMEGMGSLRQLQPQIEGETENQGEGE